MKSVSEKKIRFIPRSAPDLRPRLAFFDNCDSPFAFYFIDRCTWSDLLEGSAIFRIPRWWVHEKVFCIDGAFLYTHNILLYFDIISENVVKLVKGGVVIDGLIESEIEIEGGNVVSVKFSNRAPHEFVLG